MAKYRGRMFAAMAMAAAIALAGCGGGGGGGGGGGAGGGTTGDGGGGTGGDSNPPTGTTYRIAGTMNSAASRSAGKSAAALANKSVIAYRAGDSSKTLLNSLSDTTDPNGAFDITVNIGSNSSMNVIVEGVADQASDNILIGFDSLSQDKTGQVGNASSTRKALLFHYVPTETLDTTLTVLDNLFADKSIDLRDYITGSYGTASGLAEDLVTEMKAVMTECGITSSTVDNDDKTCIADEIGRRLATYDDAQAVVNMCEALESAYQTELGLADTNYLVLSGKLFVSTSRLAGRSADADSLTDIPVKVYQAGDSTETLLNASTDLTDQYGNFSVTIDIGQASSVDVIIEGESDASNPENNVYIALDGVSQTTSGLVGNADSSRKALLFHYAPTEDLDTTITNIDGLFNTEDIDLREYITGDYTTAATNAADMLSEMKGAMTTCSVSSSTIDDTQKQCLANDIDTRLQTTSAADGVVDMLRSLKTAYKIDLGIETQKEIFYNTDTQDGGKDLDWTKIDKVVDIFNDAECDYLSSFSTDSQDQLEELLSKMTDAIAVWDDQTSYSTENEKQVAIRDLANAMYFGDTFTQDKVKNAINNLARINGYWNVVSSDAATMTTRFSASDMRTLMSAYDNIRGMFVEVMVDDVGATRATAHDATESLLEVLAALGAASENSTSAADAMDDWVVAWDETEVRNDLLAFLAPLDMDENDKVKDLMRLAHDLNDLPAGATDAQIKDTMTVYVSEATADEAIALKNKAASQTCTAKSYYDFVGFAGIDLILSPSTDCVSKEDIVSLMETHYERDLPLFEAFIDGIEVWIESNEAKLGVVIGNQELLMNVYSDMKNDSYKTEVGQALDTAGIKKELFYLADTLETYFMN